MTSRERVGAIALAVLLAVLLAALAHMGGVR